MRTGELRRVAAIMAMPVALLAFAGLGLIGLRLWRGRRARELASPPVRWDGDPGLARVMARVESLWARHGHPRPAHRAPLEHLRAVPPGGLPPAVEKASADVIACYYDVRYGGRPVPRDTGRELARRLEDQRA